MKTNTYRFAGTILSLLTVPAALLVGPASVARADDGRGDGKPTTVYVLSNSAAGNEVLAYGRTGSGALGLTGAYPTGGTGSGSGLGSQGSVVINNNRLFAVNAGSNSVSEFTIRRDGALTLVDTEPSGGTKPISVTVSGNKAYVLNDTSNNIAGFTIAGDDGRDDERDDHESDDRDSKGKRAAGLTPIAGSIQSLTGAGAAQIEFTPNGRQLVVTEKATNTIDVFPVNSRGVAGPAVQSASVGATPFGFEFTRQGTLIVSNAAGGAAGQTSASSYTIGANNALNVRTGALPTSQTAACWTAVSENSKYAYMANTGSATITGFKVNNDGTLTMLNADGVTGRTGAGSRPADAAVKGSMLYVRSGGTLAITIHSIGNDGSLTDVGSITGLPATAVGLAA